MQTISRAIFGICATACLALGVVGSRADAADVLKPDQLVGTWVQANANADMKALDFAKGGKVSIYFGGGNDALSGDYSIAEDGRLNLSMGGLSTFFVPTLTGDQLQLKTPEAGTVSQYRRLKPGETIAGAIAGQGAADKQGVHDRNAALPNFIVRKDLVMVVINGGNAIPASSAIELVPNGNDFAGHICYDGAPPRIDEVGAQFQGSADNPTIAIWFGPGNAQQNKMMFLFHGTGSANNLTLISHVNLSREAFASDAPTTVIIKPDATMHGQILAHLKTEGTRLESLKTPVLAMLKDYVVLKGTSQSALPAEREGYVDQFTLSRDPRNNTWVGQGQLVNRATGATEIFPAMGAVGIVKDKPAIQIMSQKRVYMFTEIDATGGKLTGAWQVPQNPNGHEAQLTISQALDAKGRDQLFTTSKAGLQKLGTDTVFHAIVNDEGNPAIQPPNPVAVTLSIAANGTVSGKADYPLEGCSMTLAGKLADTPLGPQLMIQYTGGQSGPNARGDAPQFMNGLAHEAWILGPTADSAGAMRLEGYSIANTAQRTPPLSLQLLPYTDKDKAALTQALSSGTKFKLINPKMGPDTVDVVEFATDPGTGKIKGHLMTAGHQINNSANSTFSGEIKDDSGWARLEMPILRPVDRTPTYAYTIVVTPTDNGMYISAGVYNIRQGRNGPFGRWDAVEVK